MSIHLQREMEQLKKMLLSLSAAVEDNLNGAIRALSGRDAVLAETVCRKDSRIDELEVEMEEECLKALALHQPVAVDLRFIVAVIKINNDLERIGDQAVNLARKARQLAFSPQTPMLIDFHKLSSLVRQMLKESLDSLVLLDADLARAVRARDDEVDAMKSASREKVLAAVRANPAQAESLFALYGAVRNFERIADLAVNISEEVIYLIEGEIVRHLPESSGGK